jgi:tripartite-type tricarboxylate transporter receptor subunit TctC
MVQRIIPKAILAATVLGAVVIVGSPVMAQTNFYNDRSVTMLIGSGAGGGYDLYSRVLARHMGRHIPGKPHIIPKNMPGAGSIKATNYVYNVAPRDGSVFVSVFNTLPLQPLVGRKGVRYDATKLGWVGSIGKHQNICTTWHTNPVNTFEQAKSRQVVVAATGASGNAVIYPKLFNQMLGTKFKVIAGYKSADALLSVTRGETDGICGMSYQTLLASAPDWILKKQVNILAQIGLKPHPDLKGVPMALDMVKGKANRDILTFLMIPQEMGRPYTAGPGLPKNRLAALRKAFDDTMKDPAFLRDAEKARMKVEPITADAMDKLVARLGAMPPATIKAAAKLLLAKKKKKKK